MSNLKPLHEIYNQTKPVVMVSVPSGTGKNHLHLENIFNDFFHRLKGIFPTLATALKTQQDYDILRQEWVTAFAQGGITTLEQIEAGLTIARQKNTAFYPSPGQFITWCKEGTATLLGLPTVEQVMREFKRYNANRHDYESAEVFRWSSPIMYWIVTDLRKHMMQYNQSDLDVSKRAEYLLGKWLTRLSKGGTVPEIKIQIEDKTQPRTVASEIMGSDEKFVAMGQEFLLKIRSKKELSNG